MSGSGAFPHAPNGLPEPERAFEDGADAQAAALSDGGPPRRGPADAMHPQFSQSGVPPNWHGVIRCSKSAEMHVVVCANTQSSGDAEGSHTLINPPAS
jgi:hypothetical protein